MESIANRIADINLNESIEESYVELVEDESPVVGENPENTVRSDIASRIVS